MVWQPMHCRAGRRTTAAFFGVRGLWRTWPVAMVVLLLVHTARGDFPDRPIKIIVYTQPGGPIDLTARQFVEVAKRYTDATMAVENIPGAGGLVAMERLVGLQPDGHTLLACTKSNVAKAVVTGREDLLECIDWVGLLLMDPECVITRCDGPGADWQSLVDHARQHPDQQIWLGPGSGTMDHLMAIRIWEAFDIRGRWVPHADGGRAITALRGGQGIAYVGNPSDASEYPELRVTIVSGAARMPQWPDAPTFAEMGHPELDQQFIWRGFALRSGCAPEVRRWYAQLFQQVTRDAKWHELWQPQGMQVVCLGEPDFRALVQQTRDEFRSYLERLHVAPVEGGPVVMALSRGATLLAILLGNVLVALMVSTQGTLVAWKGRLIPLAVLSLCVPLLAQTWQFPPAWEGIGAAAAPRLWLTLTSLCALVALVRPGQSSRRAATFHDVRLVLILAAVTGLQWAMVGMVGYYLSVACGNWASLRLLGERRWAVLVGVTGGWLICAYLLFQRLLHVDLPRGMLFL